MEILSILIASILYVLFLALGVFIIIQNPKRKLFWYIGGGLVLGGLYIFGNVFARLAHSVQTVVFWTKFISVPAELASLLWLFSSIEILKEFNIKTRASKILIPLFTLITFIILLLLITTDILIDYKNPILIDNKYVKWDFYNKEPMLARNIFLSVKTFLPILLFISSLRKNKRGELKIFHICMLIANILIFIGANFSCYLHFFRTRYTELYEIPEFIQDIFILPGIALIGYTILAPKFVFKEMMEAARDFMSYVGYSIVLIIPYALLLLVGFKHLDNSEIELTILLSISGLVILTHSTHEWVLELIKGSIKRRRISIPIILPSDINFTLSNYSSPNKLEESKLIKLDKVKNLVEKEKISPVGALRKLIKEGIEYFRPYNNTKKRTVSRLKYEILRMIAFEGATESQIMWDLGFDVYTRSVEEKLRGEEQPRFPLRKACEYSATSDRSFKRLKKEAVEMLRWKLEEGDKF